MKDDGYLHQEGIRSGEVSWPLDALVNITEMTSWWISPDEKEEKAGGRLKLSLRHPENGDVGRLWENRGRETDQNGFKMLRLR